MHRARGLHRAPVLHGAAVLHGTSSQQPQGIMGGTKPANTNNNDNRAARGFGHQTENTNQTENTKKKKGRRITKRKKSRNYIPL